MSQLDNVGPQMLRHAVRMYLEELYTKKGFLEKVSSSMLTTDTSYFIESNRDNWSEDFLDFVKNRM